MELYDRYRFYTEDTRRTLEASNDIERWVVERFPQGATIIASEGVWRGGREMSLIIEVITDHYNPTEMRKFAEELRDMNKQETVLLTRDTIRVEFV